MGPCMRPALPTESENISRVASRGFEIIWSTNRKGGASPSLREDLGALELDHGRSQLS